MSTLTLHQLSVDYQERIRCHFVQGSIEDNWNLKLNLALFECYYRKCSTEKQPNQLEKDEQHCLGDL